jgi:metallo-beta-lactamase class B
VKLAASGSLVVSVALSALPATAPAAYAQPKTSASPANNGLFLRTARKLLRWDEPAAPARIIGPVYFVGTRGLGVFLIVGSQGHLLVNTGMPGSGPMIEASIRKLGFEPKDVKLLLAGHSHSDHVGGHAYLKKLTGAKVAMIREEVELLESGGKADFQYGGEREFEFEPAKVDRVFTDGEKIRLGDVELTAHLTPGHTRGSTTFAMTIVDGGRNYALLFPNGTSVNPGYRVARNPSYEGIGADFRRTFRVLESMQPDVWLHPHNETYRYDAKLAQSAKQGVSAWVDPDGYRRWLAAQREKFESTVRSESDESSP